MEHSVGAEGLSPGWLKEGIVQITDHLYSSLENRKTPKLPQIDEQTRLWPLVGAMIISALKPQVFDELEIMIILIGGNTQ